MKLFAKTLMLAVAGTFLAAQAFAGDRAPAFTKFPNSHRATGHILESYPIYAEGGTRQKEVCEKVQVPVYGGVDQNQRAGNALAGAVIGGILGNMATGNKAGTTAGAVLGMAAGANSTNKPVVAYKWETQCHMVEVSSSSVQYYESRIQLEGVIYRVHTSNKMRPGGTVKMFVSN